MSKDCGRPDLTFWWCSEHSQPHAQCVLQADLFGAEMKNCKRQRRFVGPSITSTSDIPIENAEPLGAP